MELVLLLGKAGRGRGWVGAAVLECWVVADTERTRGTEEGKLLGEVPVCLEGDQKGLFLLLPTESSLVLSLGREGEAVPPFSKVNGHPNTGSSTLYGQRPFYCDVMH